MAKPKEDNRDVFDKALDYGPIAGGAVVGGLLGRRSFRRAMKRDGGTAAEIRGAGPAGAIAGAPAGAYVGSVPLQVHEYLKKKHRKKK